jgi:hypothetical protein
MATGRLALNLAAFERVRFVNTDGTLTREAQQALQIVQRRVGGEAGVIYADTITTVPAGGLAATDVQGSLAELDFDKQPKDATLSALAAVATAADRLIYATGADTFALTTFTAFARALLDDIDAAAMQSTLGLAIGTNVQAFSPVLGTVAGLTPAADRLPYFTGASTAALATFTAAGRALVDDADAAAQRSTLGLAIGIDVQAWDADLDTWATKAAPAGAVVGTTDAQTLTNKTLTSGDVALASGTIGYATGNGGTVTQTTDKSTGVTLNKICGEITMNAAALAAGAAVTFTLTNSAIAAGDRIVINHAAAGTFGAYHLDARAAAGSATVVVRNLTAGSLSEAIVIGFAVFKSANA